MFSSPCCKRSLVVVIVLSCVWHLDSGMVREDPQEQIAATAAVMAIPESAVPRASELSLPLSKIKDVFAGRADCPDTDSATRE